MGSALPLWKCPKREPLVGVGCGLQRACCSRPNSAVIVSVSFDMFVIKPSIVFYGLPPCLSYDLEISSRG